MLSYVDLDHLERPIEASELRQVIKDLKAGKISGPDGFISIYYKTFNAKQRPNALRQLQANLSAQPRCQTLSKNYQ